MVNYADYPAMWTFFSSVSHSHKTQLGLKQVRRKNYLDDWLRFAKKISNEKNLLMFPVL